MLLKVAVGQQLPLGNQGLNGIDLLQYLYLQANNGTYNIT
jgi:hypothetical protein